MIAIASLLLVVSLSFLVVRIGAVALSLTGVSDEIARFQALSAFSGAGFTTGEAENVVNGPARRRIIGWLIRAGSAGVVSAISALILSFMGDQTGTWTKLVVLLVGVSVIILAVRSKRLDRITRPVIERLLRRSTSLNLQDYAGLLHLRGDWEVSEIEVERGSWLAEGPLEELGLDREGVIVLGVERPDGTYEGAPAGETKLDPGDNVILYGRTERTQELRDRQRDEEHEHHRASEEARQRGEEKAVSKPDG